MNLFLNLLSYLEVSAVEYLGGYCTRCVFSGMQGEELGDAGAFQGPW